ncbi:MAG: hypothetical protein AAFV43_11790 [Planctomycetota bacterium]
MESLLRGLNLPVHEGLSAPLSKAIAEHNADSARTLEGVRHHDDVAKKFASGDIEAGDLATAVESKKMNELVVAQAAPALWRQRGELARDAQTELAEAIEPLQAKHDKAFAAASRALDKAGLTVEAMPAGQSNGQAAQRQRDQIVSQCLPVVAARAALQDAKARVQAAANLASDSKRGEEAARHHLAKTATQAAGVA